MCKQFQEIFKKYRPGVDFLILAENETLTYLDEYGKPEKGGGYQLTMDFDKWVRQASDQNGEGYEWNMNSGCYAAFDYATKTYICTARPDVICGENGFNYRREGGTFVALRRDMAIGPADPTKLAAWKYQGAVATAYWLEKEAVKENSTLTKLLDFGMEQGKKTPTRSGRTDY